MSSYTKPLPRWLISWIGRTDLNASKGIAEAGDGPLWAALKEPDVMAFDKVFLLSNFKLEDSLQYCEWLKKNASLSEDQVLFNHVALSSPIDGDEIYAAVLPLLTSAGFHEGSPNLTFHLNPGTTMMGTMWVVLSRTLFPGRLIQTSENQKGPKEVKFPTDVSNAFLPRVIQNAEVRHDALIKKFVDNATAVDPSDTAFERILYKSEKMRAEIDRARQYALYGSIPVLILGETGTGKEEFAKAIHRASPRSSGPYQEVNCGALTSELMGSELFGHKKGAFTGATANHEGKFQAANGGTIFLDEIGELSQDAQVRLLRVLQEKRVTPLGSNDPISVDVRVIAATHRDLKKDVATGRFREDLFYRLYVGVLNLPPLRERDGDMELLCAVPLNEYNAEVRKSGIGVEKALGPEAAQVIARHNWPGNVRELFATLLRAALWAKSDLITSGDINAALVHMEPKVDGVLDRPINDEFKLEGVLNEVSRHYIERALTYAHHNKTRAAKFLGFDNYQRLDNWTRRLGISNEEASN